MTLRIQRYYGLRKCVSVIKVPYYKPRNPQISFPLNTKTFIITKTEPSKNEQYLFSSSSSSEIITSSSLFRVYLL